MTSTPTQVTGNRGDRPRGFDDSRLLGTTGRVRKSSTRPTRGLPSEGGAEENNGSNATVSEKSDTRLDMITRRVEIRGLRDIMFDRYAGDNKTKLDWSQKIYLVRGTNHLCLPAANMMSFLSAHNTNSAPKRLRDKREYKDIANACLSFVSVSGLNGEQDLPILRNGEPVVVGKFGDDADPTSGLYLHRSVARLDKGIPNPKERPVLAMPWEIAFKLTIFPNKEIKEQEIKNLISEGGVAIGLGTFRGVYGKFEIFSWE